MDSPPPDDRSNADESQDGKVPAKPEYATGVPDGFPPSASEQPPVSTLARTLEARLTQNPQLAQQLLALISQPDPSQEDTADSQFLLQLHQSANLTSSTTAMDPQDQNGPPKTQDNATPHAAAGRTTRNRNQAGADEPPAAPSNPDGGPFHATRGAMGRLLMERNLDVAAGSPPAATPGITPGSKTGSTPVDHHGTTIAFSSMSKPPPPTSSASDMQGCGDRVPMATTLAWTEPDSTPPDHARPSPHVQGTCPTPTPPCPPPSGSSASILQFALDWAGTQSLDAIQAEAKAGVDAMLAFADDPHDLTPLTHFLFDPIQGAPTPMNRAFVLFNHASDIPVVIHSITRIKLHDTFQADPDIWKWHNRWVGVVGSRHFRTTAAGTIICNDPPAYSLQLEQLAEPAPAQETSRKRIDATLAAHASKAP